ncbi:MAG TPA: hypothetical protein VKU86_02855, partial [Acidimicrobiales bacterium]|nr:hypothetical protein [Acidimicrobiales bacterium]
MPDDGGADRTGTTVGTGAGRGGRLTGWAGAGLVSPILGRPAACRAAPINGPEGTAVVLPAPGEPSTDGSVPDGAPRSASGTPASGTPASDTPASGTPGPVSIVAGLASCDVEPGGLASTSPVPGGDADAQAPAGSEPPLVVSSAPATRAADRRRRRRALRLVPGGRDAPEAPSPVGSAGAPASTVEAGSGPGEGEA